MGIPEVPTATPPQAGMGKQIRGTEVELARMAEFGKQCKRQLHVFISSNSNLKLSIMFMF